MSPFDSFINSFDSDKKGIQFEHFVKWFLLHDPEWLTQVDKVWLWNEYPDRWGPDCGIDLVFKHKNGQIWAVQAKCYDTNNTISKADIDTFLSESNRKEIDKRLLIATTDKLSKNARQVCLAQEKPVVLFLHADFDKAAIEYPSNLASLKSAKRKELPKPRSHQENAINDVIAGFKEDACGQLIMACGTGKTFTSLWIKEELNAQTTLVLLPSLSLLSQTLREWTFAAKNQFEALCVCSDVSVGNVGDDESIGSILDVAFPTTSNIQEIRSFLKKDSYKVIFSTYHSSPLIAEAQAKSSVYDFDLVFADEAHRCTGEVGNAFTTVLNNDLIKSKKKLFATATPRIYAPNMKKRASEAGVEISDMSDESLFGRVFHNLSFAEAIDKKLLTDYQVVVIGVDKPMISEWIENREILTTDSGHKTDAKIMASQIGLIKAIKDFNLKKTISFHSRVKGAKDFAENLQNSMSVISENNRPDGAIHTDFVSGQMSSYERALKLSQLKSLTDSEIGVLTNARCLSEGVDVPSLDGVAFIDPRNSQVDIIQAVGRAIRKSDNKKYGTIVLPVFIDNEEEAEESIQKSKFKPIWGVINALKSHDENLSLELSQLRTRIGRQKYRDSSSGALPGKIIFDLPKNINESFSDSLKTLIIECTTETWDFWYGLLLDYYDEFNTSNVPSRFETENNEKLGKWIHNQRTNKKNKIISKDRIQKLENLGFIWNPFEVQWNEGYDNLKKYYEKYGNSFVPTKFKSEDNYSLGKWVSHQRDKKEELTTNQLKQLNELGFIWDTFEYKWSIGFAHLKEYMIDNNGNVPVQTYKTEDKYQLGKWISHQREDFKNNKISLKKIQKLEDIGFVWNLRETVWNDSYENLKDYLRENNGNMPTTNNVKHKDLNIGNWVATQRDKYSKNLLSKERIKKLEDLSFVWIKFEDNWNKGLENLKEYLNEFGNTLVPYNYITKDGFNLGQWVRNNRGSRKLELNKQRIQKLEDLGFVWNTLEFQWNNGFEHLKEYMKTKDIIDIQKVDITDDGFPIGEWIANQRANYRNDKISLERKQRLDELGFIWSVLEHQWNAGYEYLKAYIEINGPNGPFTGISIGEFNLGYWVGTQRKSKKKNNLSEEKIKLLDDLGFIWEN